MRRIVMLFLALPPLLLISCTKPNHTEPIERPIPPPGSLRCDNISNPGEYIKQGRTYLLDGDEDKAKEAFKNAQCLEPENKEVSDFLQQIEGDPEKMLGKTFFFYIVGPDDTMTKLAQKYLHDKWKFYSLSKYNNIRNPSKVPTGMKIQIPGTDSSLPQIIILKPRDMNPHSPLFVKTDSVNIVGSVADDSGVATVSVNSKSVQFDIAGRFDYTAALSSGKNEVTIVVVDVNGNTYSTPTYTIVRVNGLGSPG
jgi:Glucodextranase, domain B/LysM domain